MLDSNKPSDARCLLTWMSISCFQKPSAMGPILSPVGIVISEPSYMMAFTGLMMAAVPAPNASISCKQVMLTSASYHSKGSHFHSYK